MIAKRRTDIALAALAGFAAVGFGAFAAHVVDNLRSADLLRTASLYAMVHALAVIACAALAGIGFKVIRGTSIAFLVGILVFGGTLTALAFGAPLWFGAITPLGGLAFLVGWAMLGVAALRGQTAG